MHELAGRYLFAGLLDFLKSAHGILLTGPSIGVAVLRCNRPKVPNFGGTSRPLHDKGHWRYPLHMENEYRRIVEEAGARYQGLCFSESPDTTLVMFDNSFGSTLCLRPKELTVARVRAKVAASDAEFRKKG